MIRALCSHDARGADAGGGVWGLRLHRAFGFTVNIRRTVSGPTLGRSIGGNTVHSRVLDPELFIKESGLKPAELSIQSLRDRAEMLPGSK